MEIFAGVVGRGVRPHHSMFHLEERPEPVELVFPFWLLRVAGKPPILVDMGFAQDACAGHGVTDFLAPELMLAKIGVQPGEIETVIISHLHWDHFYAPARFPNATFWIQNDDLRYFTETGAAHPAVRHAGDAASLALLPALVRDGRVRSLAGGETRVSPGVRTVHVGGHTPGVQITVCERKGGPVVIACDAAHFYGNLERRTPSGLYYRYDQFQDGLLAIERAKGPAGSWFPGHDPAMLARMESVGDGLYRV